MGFGFSSTLISTVKRSLRLDNKNEALGYQKLVLPVNKKHKDGGQVPKGHVAVYVYVGEAENNLQRHVIPIYYLKHPLFKDMLNRVEEEYDFSPPKGGLIIPCTENTFLHIASQVYESS